MFKFLKVGLLAIVLVLSFSASAVAVEKSKIDSIINYVKNLEAGEYNGFYVYETQEHIYGLSVDVKMLKAEENTASHDNFKLTWRLHTLKIYDISETLIQVIFRNYTSFITPRSRGFEECWMTDIEPNGLIEEHEKRYTGREYTIVICKEEDEDVCYPNWIILPRYPDGFRNHGWASPSLEELQEQYDVEINYWIKVIWGKEE